MPIYEYFCQHCQIKFEELVRNTNEPVYCARCRSNNVKRLISAVAFSSGSGKDKQFSSSVASSGCSSCASKNCGHCH